MTVEVQIRGGRGKGWKTLRSLIKNYLANNPITSTEITSGAVGAVAPSYIDGGRLSEDLSGNVTTSFKTIQSFSSVTLNSGEKIFFVAGASINARNKSGSKRLIQGLVSLDGKTLGGFRIKFPKNKFQTRGGIAIGTYEASSTLSGTLAIEIRANDTSKFPIREGSSSYSFYATIPDQ